jgi:AraC-like DNA-binding protein
MLAGFQVLGLDADALRREAGIDPQRLARLDGILEQECFERLWMVAAARAPREELPTEVGLAIPFGAFGTLDYLAGTSVDVEAGFLTLARHIRQVATDFLIEVSTGEDGSGVVRLMCPKRVPGCDISDEFTLAVCVGRFRSAVDGSFRIRTVHLTRPAPAHKTRHASLFDAPVVFGCAESALEIAKESWTLSLPRADATLQELLRNLAHQLELGETGSDLEASVRARLRILLADANSSASTVAHSLGLTERTLQRQLKDAGTSFSRVLDRFREAEAERLITGGMAFSQVALRLGFADQTAFNRAFRRWKGMCPRQWLDAHSEGASQRLTASQT